MVEGSGASATNRAYKNARRMRRELSLPEKLLWIRLRGTEVRFQLRGEGIEVLRILPKMFWPTLMLSLTRC